MSQSSRARFLTGAALLLVAASGAVHAQASSGAWRYVAAPYVMFPNMNGDIGLGNLPSANVDQKPGDIFSKLHFGAMLYLEAYNDRWALSSDVLYMDLKSDVSANGPVAGGEARAKQLGWELAALYRLTPIFEAGMAATYNRIKADVRLDAQAGGSVGAGLTKDWIDPSVVVRATVPLADKWYLQARGNLGGFGGGSDQYWQMQADIGYRYSDRTQFTFGYRYIHTDYEEGSGRDRFRYNVDSFGPTIKAVFRF